MYVCNVVAGIRKKVIPEAENETAKHRKRKQQRSKFLFAGNQQRPRQQRRQRYDDPDIDVTERRKRYDRRLVRPTMKRGNDEMDQD